MILPRALGCGLLACMLVTPILGQYTSQMCPGLNSADVNVGEGLAIVMEKDEYDTYADKMDEFVCHKAARGFRVYLFTENMWNGAAVGSQGSAGLLRNFLKTAKVEYNLHYLLIIGDPRYGKVPMKKMYAKMPGGKQANGQACNQPEQEVYSDHYYAVLQGNWDRNGDGKFGQWGEDTGNSADPAGDFGCDSNGASCGITIPQGPYGTAGATSWDLAVGRILQYPRARDDANLDAIIDKIIAYETVAPTDIAWRRNALLASVGASKVYFGEEMKDMFELQNDHGTTTRVYDSTSCYPNGAPDWLPHCGAYTMGNGHVVNGHQLMSAPDYSTVSHENVEEAWTATEPGFVAWHTHGSSSLAQYVLSSSGVDALNDATPAMVWSGSCNNAMPSNPDNLMYELLVNGAIGCVGGTAWMHAQGGQNNGAHISDTDARSTGLGMGYTFYENWAKAGGDSAGVALQKTKLYSPINLGGSGCTGWHNYLTMNLYGDPTIKVDASSADVVPNAAMVAPEVDHGVFCSGCDCFMYGRHCRDGQNVHYTSPNPCVWTWRQGIGSCHERVPCEPTSGPFDCCELPKTDCRNAGHCKWIWQGHNYCVDKATNP